LVLHALLVELMTLWTGRHSYRIGVLILLVRVPGILHHPGKPACALGIRRHSGCRCHGWKFTIHAKVRISVLSRRSIAASCAHAGTSEVRALALLHDLAKRLVELDVGRHGHEGLVTAEAGLILEYVGTTKDQYRDILNQIVTVLVAV